MHLTIFANILKGFIRSTIGGTMEIEMLSMKILSTKPFT